MPILLTNEILAAVTHELRNANESVQIISAYCKEKSIEKLDECINSEIVTNIKLPEENIKKWLKQFKSNGDKEAYGE